MATNTNTYERTKCDACRQDALYDAKTKFGCWAYLCQDCFEGLGVGLGLGKGQKMEPIHTMGLIEYLEEVL